MTEYIDIRGSLKGKRCKHKSWADLCNKCEIDRLRAENEKLRAALNLIRKTYPADNARLIHNAHQIIAIAITALQDKNDE